MTRDPWNGQRFATLRHLLGLSQTSLAETLHVTQATISNVERGDREPSQALIDRAAAQFVLPPSFFSVQPQLSDTTPVTFRKKASASVRDERRVVAEHSEAARLFATAADRASFQSGRLPRAEDFGDDPVELAEATRRAGGLGAEEPVPNMTRLLERLGVGVLPELETGFANPDENTNADQEISIGDEQVGDHISISRPHDATRRPLIAIIAHCSGDRYRMSLAHELAHLLFDQQITAPIRSTRSKEERRAFSFASALLIPDTVMRQAVSENLTLHGYLAIKAHFGISVAALIVRARNMGLISDKRARSLHIQRSSYGWTKHEPVHVAEERALLFGQCYDRAFGDMDNQAIAAEVGIMPNLLDHWFPSHANATARVVSLAAWRERRGRA
ncbi:MAG: XRE family transcriptional regulator [Bifidobacteriaceae bacterium]|nr:XRE family transcriptional regulator [Bifidobacteriaceae bacterium]